MNAPPEAWVPGSPTTLQTRFLDLATLAASGTKIVFTGYNPAAKIGNVPVPGTNTGNGTISQPTILAAAVVEVWTITATSATNFTVVGSVSGSKAAATVGMAYNNTFIAFIISAGSTPFVSGDKFTYTIALANPETAIVAGGYTQSYKETTAGLNEVIYTK
jgi:hypothetical protein